MSQAPVRSGAVGPMPRQQGDDSIQFGGRTYRVGSCYESRTGRIVHILACRKRLRFCCERFQRTAMSGAGDMRTNLRSLGEPEWMPVESLAAFVHKCTIVTGVAELRRRLLEATERRRAAGGSQPMPRIYFLSSQEVLRDGSYPVRSAAARQLASTQQKVRDAAEQEKTMRIGLWETPASFSAEIATLQSLATSMCIAYSEWTNNDDEVNDQMRSMLDDATAHERQPHPGAACDVDPRLAESDAALTLLQAQHRELQDKFAALQATHEESSRQSQQMLSDATQRASSAEQRALAAEQSQQVARDLLVNVKQEKFDAQEANLRAEHRITKATAASLESESQKRKAEEMLRDETKRARTAEAALEAQMAESLTCSICLDEPPELVYLPCGHFICCATCDSGLSKRECPKCQSKIHSEKKVFL